VVRWDDGGDHELGRAVPADQLRQQRTHDGERLRPRAGDADGSGLPQVGDDRYVAHQLGLAVELQELLPQLDVGAPPAWQHDAVARRHLSCTEPQLEKSRTVRPSGPQQRSSSDRRLRHLMRPGMLGTAGSLLVATSTVEVRPQDVERGPMLLDRPLVVPTRCPAPLEEAADQQDRAQREEQQRHQAAGQQVQAGPSSRGARNGVQGSAAGRWGDGGSGASKSAPT
jgi:hypothetical protein